MLHLAATAPAAPGDPILNIAIFGVFVAITMIIVVVIAIALFAWVVMQMR